MGVYIDNLKLPKACVDCPFCIRYRISLAYCNLLEADINPHKAKIERAKGCTLLDLDFKLPKS